MLFGLHVFKHEADAARGVAKQELLVERRQRIGRGIHLGGGVALIGHLVCFLVVVVECAGSAFSSANGR
jgi:hypothetical protein